MRASEKRKNNILIGVLLGVVVLMGIAYAAFSSNLNITGTSSMSENWCIGFDSTRTSDYTAQAGISGGTTPTGSISFDGQVCASNFKTNASLNASFKQPGDKIEYTLTIGNKGTLAAAIESIEVDGDSVTSDTTITKGNIKYIIEMPQSTSLAVNATTTMKVTAMFQNDTPVSSSSNEQQTITIAINAVQDDGSGGMVVTNPITINDLKSNTVTSGDGLYNNGDGTYTYKGANPDNYLSFAGSTWRILGIDNQGVKIISNEKIDLTGYSGVSSSDSTLGKFDIENTRTTANNSYCTSPSYGCNAWAATSHLVGTPVQFINGSKQGTVTEDASLNIYLNGDYYTNILGANTNIISGTFNVGPVTYNNNDLAAAKASEASYQWQGYVALATPSEYLAANTDQTNCGTESLNNTNKATCRTTNYLYKSSSAWWLVSAHSSRTSSVRSVDSVGNVFSHDASSTNGVRPVLYLSSNILLEGEGTNDGNIFTISQ